LTVAGGETLNTNINHDYF